MYWIGIKGNQVNPFPKGFVRVRWVAGNVNKSGNPIQVV